MIYRLFPSCPKNQEKKKGVFKFLFFPTTSRDWHQLLPDMPFIS